MTLYRVAGILLFACSVSLPGAPALAAPSGKRAPALTTGAADNWTHHGADADESGFSQLKQINAIKTSPSWAWPRRSYLDNEVTLEATPLAVDGVLYFTGSMGSVYAVDAVSGKVNWTHDPKVWEYSAH